MVIINGEVNSEKSALLDSGFYFGLGVFETILVLDKPIFLEQHINRLNNGLGKLGINKTIKASYIADCIEKNELYHCVLKVVVTEENIVVTTRQSNYKNEDYRRGFKLKVSDLRRNQYSHTVYLKSLNYSDNIIEMKRAKVEGFDEVLFLNTQDQLAEGSVSNIFFVKDSKIFTPKLQCGILDGIVRDWVIENFPVQEGYFTLEDILVADEVFITNSVVGIMKVISINDKKFNSGAIVEEISEGYKAYIDKG